VPDSLQGKTCLLDRRRHRKHQRLQVLPPLFPRRHCPTVLACSPAFRGQISSERLITYLRATSQDLPKALGLYEHNVHLSEALYGLLHSIEIATRNAMHYTLAANYGVPDWYDRAPLSPHWRGKVNEAKTASGVRATPGKVIAELTLGFWVDLVKHNNHRLLCGLGKN